MRLAAILLLAAGSLLTAQSADVEKEMDSVARIATVMVDGDLCQRIQTKRSLEFLLKTDPKDPWLASDNYDVDHEAFLRTKKTLMRLARLCPRECDVNLWMPVPGTPGKVQVMIRNVYELSSFWKWGDLHQPMPPEMKTVLESGQRVIVHSGRGMLSVLAPVYNSLNEIVGLVEVVSQQNRDRWENVK